MESRDRLRMTTQRKVILEELQKLKTHPTARQVYDLVRGRLPRISLGTVYRNLELLSRASIIRKLDTAGMEMRFDGDTSPHYHLRCLGCGRVDDLDMETLKDLEQKAEAASGYEVLGHRLEVVGFCPQCRKGAEFGHDIWKGENHDGKRQDGTQH